MLIQLKYLLKKTNSNDDQDVEQLQSYANKTYQIPLFQKRYVTIRINPDELRGNKNIKNNKIVGFKFQVQTTDTRIVRIQKEVMAPTKEVNANNSNNVLLEDLFI
ncbi:unnamed protein product, partial [Adineta steineri]